MAGRTVPLPDLVKQAITDSQSEWNDHQLLSHFVESGDEAAFATIMDRHGPMLYSVCRRLLGDSHLADDVLQATFLLLSRRCGSIRKRNSVAGWLYRVAQRLARQVRVAEAARTDRERFAVSNRSMEPRDAGWDELCLVLDEELRRLPERYRIPLLLCYLEGRTQDEAAKQLDWSVRTLRRRLERARDLLKARMIRRGATLGAGLFAGVLAPSASAVLRPELRQSILAISMGAQNAVVSPAVLRMVATATRAAIVTKIAIWSAVALVFAGVAGVIPVVWPASGGDQPIVEPQTLQAVAQNAKAKGVTPSAEPGPEQFPDPLPAKAVARLGTTVFRHGSASYWEKSLTFTADGKHLVSMGGGWIRRWDLATGNATVNLGDGCPEGRIGSSLQVTADGKTAYICLFGGVSTTAQGGYTRDFIQYDLESGAKKQSYRLKFHPSGASPPIVTPDGKVCAGFGHLERDDPPAGVRQEPRGESIVLWKAADGTVLHEFNLDLKDGNWQKLTFAPDGRSLIIGDTRHTIHVFDVTTGKELRTFGVANINGLSQMAVSPDGKLLATRGGDDSFIRLWDPQKGTEKRTFDLPEGAGAESLVFTLDSNTLFAGVKVASAGRRFAVYSWNVESGNPGQCWTDDPTIGATLAFSPDGHTLATMNSETGVIQFWDRKTGKERRSRETNASSLRAVCFRPDGKTILTVGNDLAIREWDASNGRLHEPPIAKAKGRGVRFSADGKALIGTGDKTIWLQDPTTGKVLVECAGTQGVLSPDGKHLAITDEDGRVRLKDVETAKIVATWLPDETEMRGGSRPMVRGFSADGKSLILQGDIVSVWDIRTRKRRSSWSLEQNKVLEYYEHYEMTAEPKKGPERKAPDRKGSGGEGPQMTLVTRKEEPESVAVSADGSKITFAVRKLRWRKRPEGGLSPAYDLRLMTLETATGKVIHQSDIDNADSRPWQLALSSDGSILAAGTRKIRVWDLKTGKEIHQFDGHRAEVTSLAFSPDNKRLVSASKDSTALVWELSK